MRQYDNDDLNRSIFEGIFSHMFATLTSGLFLTGFAIHMGMSVFEIGIMAAMPFLVTVVQVPASHLMGRNGRRKKFWYWGATAGRFMWLPIVALALLPDWRTGTKIPILLALVLMSHICVSVSHVSWLSLMSDLVPESIRGRFFGTRNMLCGAAGMCVMLVFGRLLDFAKAQENGMLSMGFGFTFMTAILFGTMSLYFIRRISDPHATDIEVQRSFGEHLLDPVQHSGFRRFLLYGFFWSASVHFAAPFFTLYFLTELKFSYGFVAALGITSGLADLVGMRLWGRISDRVKNKPIIRLGAWVVTFIPIAWLLVRPSSVLIPIAINIVGGGFWAGINLCTNNLLLNISPRENRASFLSLYNVAAGLGAAAGPVLAGALVTQLGRFDLTLLSWQVLPLHVVFLTSTAFRLLSLHLFKRVHEPEEVAVSEMIRILKGIRGLNIASGFSYVLHPFVELSRGGFRYGFNDIRNVSEREVEGDITARRRSMAVSSKP